LRITIIGPVYPYRGGIAHYTTQLSRTFGSSGHQVQVISFRRQYPSWLYPGISDQDPSQDPQRVSALYTLDPIYPWTWTGTANIVARYQPDAVIIQWWTTFWSPAYWVCANIFRRKGFKVVFLIHNVFPHESRPWDALLTSRTLSQGDAYLVHTEHQKELLLSLLPKAVVNMYPMPAYNLFSSRCTDREEAKKLFGISPKTQVLLFFGIIRPYKGLKYALEALAQVREKVPDIHLIVAGEFWEEVDLYRGIIERLDLEDQVTIENRYIPDEEVGFLFSAADVFIAPYVDGTQSASVKVALGFELPMVTTDPIADELLINNPIALIVPPGNSQALADAIVKLLLTPVPFKAYREQPSISWEKLVQNLERMVSSIK